MRALNALLLTLFVIFSNQSFADDLVQAADISKKIKMLDYDADYWFFLIKQEGVINLMKISLGEVDTDYYKKVDTFILEANQAIKTDYQGLKTLLDGNQPALNSLNDFVSSAISDIESLKVGFKETERSYEMRVAVIEREFNKKRKLFQLQF